MLLVDSKVRILGLLLLLGGASFGLPVCLGQSPGERGQKTGSGRSCWVKCYKNAFQREAFPGLLFFVVVVFCF